MKWYEGISNIGEPSKNKTSLKQVFGLRYTPSMKSSNTIKLSRGEICVANFIAPCMQMVQVWVVFFVPNLS